MKIYVVAPQQVAGLWPRIADYVDQAISVGWSELYAAWDVKKNLIDGAWLLWIAVADDESIKGAVVLRTQDYPKCRVCEVLLCGGEELDSWLDPMMAAVEGFARTKGAAFLQCYGRPAWGKVCGGREQSRVFLKELG